MDDVLMRSKPFVATVSVVNVRMSLVNINSPYA